MCPSITLTLLRHWRVKASSWVSCPKAQHSAKLLCCDDDGGGGGGGGRGSVGGGGDDVNNLCFQVIVQLRCIPCFIKLVFYNQISCARERNTSQMV